MSLKKKMKELFAGRDRKGKLDQNGAEILDEKPFLIPSGIRRPPTQEMRLQQITQRLKAELQQEMSEEDYLEETDFSDEDPDMLTGYEYQAHVFDMQPVAPEAPPEDSPSAPPTAGESESSSDDKSE